MTDVSEPIKIWYDKGTVHIRGDTIRATVKLTPDQLWHMYKGFSESSLLEIEIKEGESSG